MRILYDGWSLVHDPVGPGSLHLLSILENLPAEITPVLAMPEAAPDWLGRHEVHLVPAPNTPYGRLRWEQSFLPSLAKITDVELLHLTAPTAPAWSRLITVFSPTGFGAGIDDWSGVQQSSQASNHFLDRMRTSLGQGGLVRFSKVIWPADLPGSGLSGPLADLPPVMPPYFSPDVRQNSSAKIEMQLPEEFILYHGPGGRGNLENLAQAWNWAAAAIGGNYPLLLVGLEDEDWRYVSELIEIFDFGDSLCMLPDVHPPMLPKIYQQSAAVIHSSPASPWCGPVRLAMASGKPLVAIENEITGAITGPAAYLAEEHDARALGAALVTMVVEEDLASTLSDAAYQRTQNWRSQEFGAHLSALYHSLVRMK